MAHWGLSRQKQTKHHINSYAAKVSILMSVWSVLPVFRPV